MLVTLRPSSHPADPVFSAKKDGTAPLACTWLRQNPGVVHRSHRRLTALAVAFALMVCFPTQIDSARWWHSARLVSDLRLSVAQRSAIDLIYERSLSERMAMVERARLARGRLQRLLDADAPIQVLEEAASQAADADAARRRLRTMMLYRISRVLNPEQRARLAALARERPRGTAP